MNWTNSHEIRLVVPSTRPRAANVTKPKMDVSLATFLSRQTPQINCVNFGKNKRAAGNRNMAWHATWAKVALFAAVYIVGRIHGNMAITKFCASRLSLKPPSSSLFMQDLRFQKKGLTTRFHIPSLACS